LEYFGRGVDVDPLISHRPHLSEAAGLFDKMVNKSETVSRVIFHL